MVDTLWSLPDDWEWVTLDKVCKLLGGGTPKRIHPEYFNGDIIWVTPTDLDIDNPVQKINDSQTKITQLGLNSSSAKLLPAGTILFSSRATIGKIGIAGVPLSTNQGFANLVCNEGFDNHYLAWSLKRFTENIKQLASSTTYLEISKGNLRKFKIPIPYPNNPKLSLDIQQRIVARIESLLGEIKRNRLLLKQMRLDTDLLLPNALDEVVERLDSKRQKLLDVIQEKPRNGWSPKCDNNPNGVPVLKLGAVLRFQYNPDEIKRTSLPTDKNAHYWLEAGDILISRSNTLDLVGHASIYSGIPYPCIYPDLMMRFRVNPNKADSKFLIYWLQSKEVRNYIQTNASGASPTMKKIKQETVCNIPFPIISIEEQSYFAYHLDAIQQEVKKINKVIEEDENNFNYLEQAILEKAFRGEL